MIGEINWLTFRTRSNKIFFLQAARMADDGNPPIPLKAADLLVLKHYNANYRYRLKSPLVCLAMCIAPFNGSEGPQGFTYISTAKDEVIIVLETFDHCWSLCEKVNGFGEVERGFLASSYYELLSTEYQQDGSIALYVE